MNSLQLEAGRVATIGTLVLGGAAQAAKDLDASVAQHVDALSAEEMARRLDGALRALRSEWAPVADASAEVKEILIAVARSMVDSYSFHNKTEKSTFSIPAGLTEFEAIRALNVYFREHHPRFKRDAIYEGDLYWYKKLPEKYPDYCQQRDYSCARQISLQGVVKGTNGKSRAAQGAMLKADSLIFSDPRYLAIAAALHACKHEGADLLQDFWIRGSIPEMALHTERFLGVLVFKFRADNDCKSIAASGSVILD